MPRKTIRLHKQLYAKVIKQATVEMRTKSAMVTKILETSIKQAKKKPEFVFKFSELYGIYKGTNDPTEKTHTVFPHIGFVLSDAAFMYLEEQAIKQGNESIQNIATEFIIRYFQTH